MLLENVSLRGSVNIIIFDTLTNREKRNVTIPNMIVTSGCTFLAQLLAGSSMTEMSHMAIGSGQTSPASGDIKLYSELMRSQITSTTVIQQSVVYETTFQTHTGDVYPIKEAGIFNSQTADAGTMLCRTSFNTVNKEPQDTLKIIWTIQINNSCP